MGRVEKIIFGAVLSCLAVLAVPKAVKADPTYTIGMTGGQIYCTMDSMDYTDISGTGVTQTADGIEIRLTDGSGNYATSWSTFTSSASGAYTYTMTANDSVDLITNSYLTQTYPATRTIDVRAVTTSGGSVTMYSAWSSNTATTTALYSVTVSGDSYATYTLEDSYGHSGVTTGYGYLGDTVTLRATGITSGRSFSGWTNGTLTSTSNPVTITVSSSGNAWTGSTASSFIPVTDITDVPSEITAGYELSLSGNSIPTTVVPSNATNRTITWSVASQNGTGATVSGETFEATSAGTATVRATITNGTSSGNYTEDFSVTVYKTPTLSYNSSTHALTVSLPSKVITGYGVSTNITSVTGGYLQIYYNSSSIYNSGTTYQTSGTSFTIAGSTVESIVESAGGSLSGTSASIEFVLTPVGHTSSNTSGYEEAVIYATSGSVTAYEVVVAGTNILTSTYYGLAGTSLTVTAIPISGYSFSQWADGSTSNPRTITISTSAYSNGYVATGVLGVNRSSSTASDSGYDSVPKTGENHAVFWLLLIAASSGLAAGFLLIKRILWQRKIGKKRNRDVR